MRKILKVLFLSLFLISITFAKTCSEKKISEMKNFLDNSKQELTHFLYNKIYLTDKRNQLTKLEKDIHTCLQKNTQKIQDIQNLKNNFTPGGNLSQLQHMYDKKIWAIKNTIYQLENNLLAIDNLSILIQKQEKANNLQNNQINDFKNIQEHWRSYKADPNRSIQLTPLHEVFPYVYHLYQNQPMVLVLFLISGLIAGFFGKKIAFFVLHQPFVKKNRNIQLWMQYSYYLLPSYCFITTISFFLHYGTHYWLNPPNSLILVDLIFRIFSLYFLILLLICFFSNPGFDKHKMIRLLIESLTILGCLNLSKVIYVILINKTNFSQLIFYLIYLPIGHLVIFNYLGFKWAFIQKPLPFNHFKNRVYQCSCVGIVWLYLIISIIANHQGYIALTLSQILFGIVLVILYYQLIFMQLRPNQYFSDKQISFLTACQIKLFGKTNKATFELKILLASVNVMVFLLLIYMLFGIFNVPNYFFYIFHDIISSTITIGAINFSLLNLMLGGFAFSCIVCVESVMTHLLLQQKINHTPSSIFKTQINFIHYFFKVLALIIALLIIGIQSSHLMVIIGSLGLGAGFGLQFIIENLLSGIFIIIKKNFLVGDTIKVINTVTGDCIFEGKIVHIYSMETLCINKDQNQVILPNATLFRNEVIKLNEETTKSS